MKHSLHLLTLAALCLTAPASRAQTLTATVSSDRVTTMSNGLVTLTIGSNGRVSALTPQGGSNVIGSSGIYFDYTADKNYALSPTKAEVVRKDDDMVEVVYSNLANNPQLSQGFILRRGVSGVYVYVTVGGTQASASVSMREIRVCTRLASTFLNGYVDDTMQGRIPSNSEMKTAEQSENVVADATYRLADGSIYTKYDWTQYIVRDSVHGLMNDNTGVWNIACSHEWANGGPMKQELTVHATSKSPITIQMLQGEHMGASAQTFGNGDEKLYGPFLIYVNRGTPDQMIADAKATAHRQQQEWPFAWFRHKLWPQQRTTVEGTLSVATGQRNDSIQVVLAEPGSDVYTQGKRYIYWALTDSLGHFSIPAVRPADYTLYAYATSFGGYLFLKYISENENPFRSLAFRCPAVNMYDVITGAIMQEEDLAKVEKGKDILVGFDRKIKISRNFLQEVKAADITLRDFSDFCGEILILQGTKDEIVPFAAVEAFADRNLLDFEAVENADHRFIDPKIMERAIIRIADFFDLR